MENIRNKSRNIKSKDYFERFTKLNVYSFTKPNDNKLYIGSKPDEVYSLFNGNTSTIKKEVNIKNPGKYDNLNIDQSTLQYYIILALEDFHCNYYLPLVEENKSLKADINKLNSIIIDIKHKNDKRFEYHTTKIHNCFRHDYC